MVGRWLRVRELSAAGWGRPWMFDRKWNTLDAFECDEWWKSPDGRWRPTIRGGAFSSLQYPRVTLPFLFESSNITTGAFLLNSAFTYATSGDTIGWRIQPLKAAKNLQSVYIFATAFSAAAPQVTFELRNAGIKPGTIVTNGALNYTIAANTASRWYKATYSSLPTLAAGTEYWLIVYNSAADPVTNDVTLAYRDSNSNLGTTLSSFSQMTTATDGYTANPTITANPPILVLGFDDGTWWGSPWSATTAPATDANRKGLYVGGFTEQLSLCGAGMLTTTGPTTLELFASATAPDGAALATTTATVKNTANLVFGYMFGSPQTLAKATAYRIVGYNGGANFALPVRRQIGTAGTGASIADLQAAMWGGNAWYYALATGPNTSWSDANTEFPSMTLYVEDQVAVAGGGGPLIGGRLVN